MADLQEAGLKLVAEGADAFESAIDGVGGVLASFGNIALDAASMAADALGSFFADSFSGALEAEQTIARLGQVIESTGGAAGITVKDAEALADQFKDLAGGSDDAVLSIIDMGLRMGTVSEEQMPSFIQSTLDLGAIMGDTGKASQVMSRAIEDPVGTLGALRKAGILVNEETEAQIKAMVKSGDTAGAYALLMDRVGEATEGAAETMANTTAGQWAIFQETIADAGETIVGAFLPALNGILAGFMPLVPIITEVATVIGNMITDFIDTGGDFGSLIDNVREGFMGILPPEAIEGIAGFIENIHGVVDFVIGNMPLVQSTFETVWGAVTSVLQGISDFVTVTLMPAIASIWEQSGAQLPTAQETFETVMGAITTAATGVAAFFNETLIPAVTEVVNWIVTHWPEIQAKAEEIWTGVQTTVQGVVDWFNGTLIPTLTDVKAWLDEKLPPAIQALSDFWTNTLLPAITSVSDWITGTYIPTLTTLWTWIGTTLTEAIQKLSDFWTVTLLPAITTVHTWLDGTLFPFLTSLSNLLDAVMGAALKGLATIWEETLLPAVTKVYDFFNTYLKPIFDTTSSTVSDTMQPALSGMSDFITNTFIGALNSITGAFDGITAALKLATTWFDNIAAAITGVPDPPDVYTPGSPTPFEKGMWGIVDAMRAVTNEAMSFDVGVGKMIAPPMSSSAMGAQYAYSNTDARQFNLNVSTDKPMTTIAGEFAVMQTLYGGSI